MSAELASESIYTLRGHNLRFCAASGGRAASLPIACSGLALRRDRPLQGASALARADRSAGGQHAVRNPCSTLAGRLKKCTLGRVQLRNLGLKAKTFSPRRREVREGSRSNPSCLCFTFAFLRALRVFAVKLFWFGSLPARTTRDDLARPLKQSRASSLLRRRATHGQ